MTSQLNKDVKTAHSVPFTDSVVFIYIMNDLNLYSMALLIFGIVSTTSAIFILKINLENIKKWEKLPRNILLGSILTLADLIWCIPHTKPLIGESLHGYLLPAAFLLTWVAYQFLDYLFSRSLGGLFILLSHYFLSASYGSNTIFSPLFVSLCLIMGVTGIFFAGRPYLFRDLLRKVSSAPKLKYSISIYMILFGLFSITCGIIQLLK